MIITFKQFLPVEETMIFEKLFEPELALDREEKEELLTKSFVTWMFVNGQLIGETYGTILSDLDEKIEDTKDERGDTIYCYSTAILPQAQGKGLAKILKAYWLGTLTEFGDIVVGHATTEGAYRLNRFFGAEFGATHDNWCGTKRKATYYRIVL
jgi:GNAT superfamily N-acetyltransferase